MFRVGYLRGTWEPVSHKFLNFTGNVEEYFHFITFIAKYTFNVGRNISNSPVGLTKPEFYPTLGMLQKPML